MSDGSIASTATSDTSASSAPQNQAETSNAVARSNDPTRVKSDGGDELVAELTGSTPAPKQSKAKPAPKAETPEEEDSGYELDGEKLTKAQLKEYRDIAKRQKDFERASHERMQKAAEERKAIAAEREEMVQLANALKQNPWALHEKMGINPDEIAEQRLLAQMKRAQMSPEEIAAQEAKAKQEAELNELRRFKEETETKTKTEQHNQLVAQFKAHYDQQIATAITSANLPKTLESTKRVARVMADYKAQGVDIDPVIAGQIVKRDYGKDITHEAAELAKANPQALIEMLGTDVIAAIMKSQAKQAKEFEPQKPRNPVTQQFTKAPEARTFDDVRAELKAKGLY